MIYYIGNSSTVEYLNRAFAVRLLTRRYIWDYGSGVEAFHISNIRFETESVTTQVCDLACPDENMDNTALNSVENHCRSADAIILLYAINDHSSLEEAERLKFLIDTTRKRRRFSVNNKHLSTTGLERNLDIPVALVGNKADLVRERLVSAEEGRKRALSLNCPVFQEISVKDNADEVLSVAEELYRLWKKNGRNFSEYILSPPSGNSWGYGSNSLSDSFRSRSSTEGSATLSRIRAWPFTRMTTSKSAFITDVSERCPESRRTSFFTNVSP
ncbi:ras-related and estrogen-regulated growth inhibitor-like isoform X2 [Artemia franciscana]|uniref:ras-related and estrogen-regulated growth inhibitor-like isoform X2 n=1 Tax=Artemia franciscana TaxID=6661 RepID=UPI0032DA1615